MTLEAEEKNSLPWWTWVLPILLFHLGTQISLQFRYEEGISTFYLPTGILLVLLNVWGPWRTIPAMYLNAMLSTPLWGVENVTSWFIYPIPETLFGILSWLLYNRWLKGKAIFRNNTDLMQFLVFALAIPLIIELTLLQVVSTVVANRPIELFVGYVIRNWIGEFIANFGIGLFILHFAMPWLATQKLTYYKINFPIRQVKLTTRQAMYLAGICLATYLLSIFLDFHQFWYIYGFGGLIIALYLGFNYILIYNLYIFILTYIVPESDNMVLSVSLYNEKIFYIFLGNLLLSVFSTITASILRDLNNARNELETQKLQLQKVNEELDRFVYSVSHDISAPLKSIQGLVSLFKIENPNLKSDYISKIEQSVKKQEQFIAEILQYSRNKRQEIKRERIDLRSMCEEILEDFRYHKGFEEIRINLDVQEEVISDTSRVRVILQNIIGNAVKFRRYIPGEQHHIRISSQRHTDDSVVIQVTDNGEGIPESETTRIFEMFQRASEKSQGSGLGLYIARLAAEKIEAQIAVRSQFGYGSTFSVAFPPGK